MAGPSTGPSRKQNIVMLCKLCKMELHMLHDHYSGIKAVCRMAYLLPGCILAMNTEGTDVYMCKWHNLPMKILQPVQLVTSTSDA